MQTIKCESNECYSVKCIITISKVIPTKSVETNKWLL